MLPASIAMLLTAVVSAAIPLALFVVLTLLPLPVLALALSARLIRALLRLHAILLFLLQFMFSLPPLNIARAGCAENASLTLAVDTATATALLPQFGVSAVPLRAQLNPSMTSATVRAVILSLLVLAIIRLP